MFYQKILKETTDYTDFTDFLICEIKNHIKNFTYIFIFIIYLSVLSVKSVVLFH